MSLILLLINFIKETDVNVAWYWLKFCISHAALGIKDFKQKYMIHVSMSMHFVLSILLGLNVNSNNLVD